MTRTTLLQRPSISVSDFRCSAGPGDTPFVEQYASHSISYVRKGSFGCRCRGRFFELVAGSILVGHPGDEFICTHDHVCGDECLSFFLSPELVQAIGDRSRRLADRRRTAAAGTDGARRTGAGRGLRPQRSRPRRGRADLRQPFCRGGVRARPREPKPATARDRRRAVETALWIDAHSHRADRSGQRRGAGGTQPVPFPAAVLGRARRHPAPISGALAAAACRAAVGRRRPGRSPTSPTTSASAISPISSAPSTAPPGFRRDNSARLRAACARFSKNASPCTD